MANADLDERIKEEQARLKNASTETQEKAHEAAKHSEKQEPTEKETSELNSKLNVLLRGVNDTFKKHYNFEEDGLDFNIEIKVPNALEEAQIADKVYALFPDSNFIPGEVWQTYYTIYLVHDFSKGAPKALTDIDNIYNTDWFTKIGADYQQWRSQFRY